MSYRSRSWIVTVHVKNMIKAGLSKKDLDDYSKVADMFLALWENSGKGRSAGIVICTSEDGSYHAHMACYGNTTTLKSVAEVLFDSHVEPIKSGKETLLAYLRKEGKFKEKGEVVHYEKGLENISKNQGKRNDLEEIEILLAKGFTPEKIFDESFTYRKYEKMVKSGYLSKRIKETPLEKEMNNEYHFGESGTGKTYEYINLCIEHGEEDVYLLNEYSNSLSGGFDLYIDKPGRFVFLDEFRGDVKFSQLLSILDKYSRNQVRCRYQNTYQLWTSVYIASICPIEDVYNIMVKDPYRKTDSFKQLLRRINTIVYHYIDKENVHQTFRLPASDYINSEDMIKQAYRFEKNKNN